MKVRRIVANVATAEIAAAKRFYGDVLGLDVLMDMGWIATYGSKEDMSVQISFMNEGGSGTPVPDLSIEVDDLDVSFQEVVHSDRTGETGVTRLQHSPEGPNEHPQECPSDATASRGDGAVCH